MKDASHKGFLRRQPVPCDENYVEVKVVSSNLSGRTSSKKRNSLQSFLYYAYWIIIIGLVFSGGFYLGYARVFFLSSLHGNLPDSHQVDGEDFYIASSFKETRGGEKEGTMGSVTESDMVSVEENIVKQGNCDIVATCTSFIVCCS